MRGIGERRAFVLLLAAALAPSACSASSSSPSSAAPSVTSTAASPASAGPSTEVANISTAHACDLLTAGDLSSVGLTDSVGDEVPRARGSAVTATCIWPGSEAGGLMLFLGPTGWLETGWLNNLASHGGSVVSGLGAKAGVVKVPGTSYSYAVVELAGGGGFVINTNLPVTNDQLEVSLVPF
jgi:hypothetical protein